MDLLKLVKLMTALLVNVILLFGIMTWHFTAKSASLPVYLADQSASPGQTTSSNELRASALFTPFLTMIPDQNGTTVFVSAGGVGQVEGTLFANLEFGPANTKGGYAMTYSNTLGVYLAEATGFTPGLDEAGTLSLTTTTGLNSGSIEFQRAFVQTTQPETVMVDNGNFTLEMPNPASVPYDAYLVVMSTHASPGPLPAGYRLASAAYNLRPSGSLTQSEKLMTLELAFALPLPDGSDPHTLAIASWDRSNQAWTFLEGNLFDDTNDMNFTTRRFGLYALVTTPTWRDSFKEASLTGVSLLSQTRRADGEEIILDGAATGGTVTSLPITPPGGAANWGTLHFSATIPSGTGLIVDVLNSNDEVVLANVSDGVDLSSLLPFTTYPSLKLRATLTTATPGLTPRLHEWSLSWTSAERRVYLPVVVKGG